MNQFLTEQSVKIMILRTTTQNEITELLCQWFLIVQRAVAEEELFSRMDAKPWRRALIFAIRKPEKPLGDPKSYSPMHLLCVPFKIFERLIYARVDPIFDPLLPRVQAGFRHGRSTVDQVTLLT